MKKKQLIAVVLILMMSSMTFLSGCSTKKESNETASGKQEISTTVDESGKVDGVMYKEGLPIVDPGDYSFSLFTDGNKTVDEFYLMPVLEEQTGINVDVQLFPYDVAKERYSLSLNSGDYADVIGGWILSSTDILKFGVEMGTFIPLEDYFEAYCPNISAALDLEGVREKMTAPDGHIYSIPYVLDAPLVDFNPYINTRWLKNLGLEVPKTTEDLEKVLTAFKEQDANGNGDPNDEIPFSFDPTNKNLPYMAGYFGMSLNEEGFTMVGDKLTFGADKEPFKDLIMYLADLYEKGLLDPEMFTQDGAQWKAKGGQDLYGVCMMYGSGDIMPYERGETPDWIPLPVLSSEKCDSPVWYRDTYGTTVLKNQVVITDNAKNPAAIARWWDNLFELENSIQTNGGPLGIALFKKDNGYEIDKSKLTEEEKDKYGWANLYPQSLPRYIPAGFKFLEETPSYPEKQYVGEAYEPYLLDKVIPPYWATIEESGRLSEIKTSITDYITEKTAEWIAGQADVEAEWDSYLKHLDKLNLDEYIEIRENAIKAGKK